jgi:hypothetical protein
MNAIRQSSATHSNPWLEEVKAPSRLRLTNTEWLKAQDASEGIIFLGGCSVSHFRLRVAQAHLRPNDLTPSIWSQVGILLDAETFLSVPLTIPGEVTDLARLNGVQRCRLRDYDDPEMFPNIGVVRFPAAAETILKNAEMVSRQRSIVDLLALTLPWLAYVLSVGQSGNPLLTGGGIPSAVFVEVVYGMAGVELTPGLSSSTSCPEAIWQAAKWWHPFYEKEAADLAPSADAPLSASAGVPAGAYSVRQPAAAAVGPKDEVISGRVVMKEQGSPPSASSGKGRPGAGKSAGSRSSKKSG